MDEVGVGDVDGHFVGREADTVRSTEAIGNHTDVPGGRIEPVNLLRELRLGPKSLFVAVDGIREPDGAIGMDDYIVGGIKRTGVVVIYQGSGFVRSLGFHVDETCGFIQGTLSAEDETVTVIRAAIGHVVSFRTANFVAGKVYWGVEFDFCNDDFLVGGCDCVRGVVGHLVGGYEEGV